MRTIFLFMNFLLGSIYGYGQIIHETGQIQEKITFSYSFKVNGACKDSFIFMLCATEGWIMNFNCGLKENSTLYRT